MDFRELESCLGRIKNSFENIYVTDIILVKYNWYFGTLTINFLFQVFHFDSMETLVEGHQAILFLRYLYLEMLVYVRLWKEACHTIAIQIIITSFVLSTAIEKLPIKSHVQRILILRLNNKHLTGLGCFRAFLNYYIHFKIAHLFMPVKFRPG